MTESPKALAYLLLGADRGVIVRGLVERHVVAFGVVCEPVHQRQRVGISLRVERKLAVAYPAVVFQALNNVIQHSERLIIRVDIHVGKSEFPAAGLLYRLARAVYRSNGVAAVYLRFHYVPTVCSVGSAAAEQHKSRRCKHNSRESLQ